MIKEKISVGKNRKENCEERKKSDEKYVMESQKVFEERRRRA